jgi:hypothetical protein
MPKEQLQALAADVDRLLVAGGAVAAGDEGLRRRGKVLRELGKQVPALGQIADAVDRVSGGPSRASAALLDLLLVVRQVRASMAVAGVDGPLMPVPSSGPWTTAVPTRDLFAVSDMLAARSRPDRTQVLENALGRQQVVDLRLVGSLLAGLEDGNSYLANLIAEQALPAFGPAVLPELLQGLNFKGGRGDARWLMAVCRIDRRAGLEACRKALADGSAALRLQALKCLPLVDQAEAEREALSLLSRGILPTLRADTAGSAQAAPKILAQEASREVRGAALAALAFSRRDAALDALLAAVSDHEDVWEEARSALQRLPHPQAVERLVRELEVAAAEALPALKAKPAAKAKGKGPSQPAITGDSDRSGAVERACRLAEVLGLRREGQAVAALVPLLQHPVADLREAGIEALIELNGPAGLVAAAVLVNDPKVWQGAMRAAWKLPAPACYERLSPLCDQLSHPKKAQRMRADLLLELFEQEAEAADNRRQDWDPRWAEILLEHLDGPNRAGVAIALEVVSGKDAVPALLCVLVPSVKKGECGVVEALGRLRVREAAAPMIDLLPGQAPHHYCIHDALRRIGDREALPALRKVHDKVKDHYRKWQIQRVIDYLEKQTAANK